MCFSVGWLGLPTLGSPPTETPSKSVPLAPYLGLNKGLRAEEKKKKKHEETNRGLAAGRFRPVCGSWPSYSIPSQRPKNGWPSSVGTVGVALEGKSACQEHEAVFSLGTRVKQNETSEGD